MSIYKLIKQGIVLLETAFFSRYSSPEKYQNYVVESGRQELAEEVASVVLTASGRQKLAKPKVLDVAAGTGLVSQALLEADCSVVAFDHSAAMLNALKRQFKGIKTQVGDMNQPWPFVEAQFDVVTIVWGNRYIVNLEHFSREALRVLKPGGVLVWPIFWLERPLWWLFLLKKMGISQLFSIVKLAPKSIADTLRFSGFNSITFESSKLQREVGWWQKPRYVIAKKA